MNKQEFIALGGKEWSNENMERVYISADIFNILQGTNFSDSSNKFFLDCKTSQLMRSYKGKKPVCVEQY